MRAFALLLFAVACAPVMSAQAGAGAGAAAAPECVFFGG